MTSATGSHKKRISANPASASASARLKAMKNQASTANTALLRQRLETA